MLPNVCRCCGEPIQTPRQENNPNLCASCQWLTEDDSPRVAVKTLPTDWEEEMICRWN